METPEADTNPFCHLQHFKYRVTRRGDFSFYSFNPFIIERTKNAIVYSELLNQAFFFITCDADLAGAFHVSLATLWGSANLRWRLIKSKVCFSPFQVTSLWKENDWLERTGRQGCGEQWQTVLSQGSSSRPAVALRSHRTLWLKNDL